MKQQEVMSGDCISMCMWLTKRTKQGNDRCAVYDVGWLTIEALNIGIEFNFGINRNFRMRGHPFWLNTYYHCAIVLKKCTWFFFIML